MRRVVGKRSFAVEPTEKGSKTKPPLVGGHGPGIRMNRCGVGT